MSPSRELPRHLLESRFPPPPPPSQQPHYAKLEVSRMCHPSCRRTPVVLIPLSRLPSRSPILSLFLPHSTISHTHYKDLSPHNSLQ